MRLENKFEAYQVTLSYQSDNKDVAIKEGNGHARRLSFKCLQRKLQSVGALLIKFME